MEGQPHKTKAAAAGTIHGVEAFNAPAQCRAAKDAQDGTWTQSARSVATAG
jgi:hypothetical protein